MFNSTPTKQLETTTTSIEKSLKELTTNYKILKKNLQKQVKESPKSLAMLGRGSETSDLSYNLYTINEFLKKLI